MLTLRSTRTLREKPRKAGDFHVRPSNGDTIPSKALNASTRKEWRELGFFYDRDDETNTWRLLGSKSGLLKFASSVRAYADRDSSQQISEHEHFGPYWYLEVGTWHTPEITDHWLAGPPSALAALAETMEHELQGASEGTVIQLRARYSPASPYEFQLEVQVDGFDPAQADPNCIDAE